MNRLTEERLLQVGMLCASTAIATVAILAITKGKLIGWLVAVPFALLIPFQAWQAARPDEYHLARIEKKEKWIQRHPIIWIIACVGGLVLAIVEFFQK